MSIFIAICGSLIAACITYGLVWVLKKYKHYYMPTFTVCPYIQIPLGDYEDIEISILIINIESISLEVTEVGIMYDNKQEHVIEYPNEIIAPGNLKRYNFEETMANCELISRSECVYVKTSRGTQTATSEAFKEFVQSAKSVWARNNIAR